MNIAKLNKYRSKCYFSWHVARKTICDIYSHNQQEQPIFIFPLFFFKAMDICIYIHKIILKFIQEDRETITAKTILKKKSSLSL